MLAATVSSAATANALPSLSTSTAMSLPPGRAAKANTGDTMEVIAAGKFETGFGIAVAPRLRTAIAARPARSPFQKHAVYLLLTPDEFDVCLAQHRDALVVPVRSTDCDSVVSRCQVGFAISPDIEITHHVDLGAEAIPPIRIQELDGSVTHDVDAWID